MEEDRINLNRGFVSYSNLWHTVVLFFLFTLTVYLMLNTVDRNYSIPEFTVSTVDFYYPSKL